MASNILTTNTTGPLDWSKVAISAVGAITASSIVPSHVQHDGVKYKKQTFEDRPTIFGDRLRISWRVTDFEVHSSLDDKFLLEKYRHVNAAKLEHHIKGACPDCAVCPHLKVAEQQHVDMAMSETCFSLTALCDLDKKEGVMIRCPNGTFAVMKGMTALVPDHAPDTQQPITEIPATEVHKQEPQPYIRSQERDRPTSAAPDAW